MQLRTRKSQTFNLFNSCVILFVIVFALGIGLKAFSKFWGIILVSLLIIILFSIIVKQAWLRKGTLRIVLTLLLICSSIFSFANRKTLMGFDLMSMAVPVMEPTVRKGERFLVTTWYESSDLKRGTIVIHSFENQNGLYLNRIVAVEGDKIEIKNGLVFINDELIKEDYIDKRNVKKPESRNMAPLKVPAGHFFVMGDNRDESFGDSRFSGSISILNIQALPTGLVTSANFNRIGKPIN